MFIGSSGLWGAAPLDLAPERPKPTLKPGSRLPLGSGPNPGSIGKYRPYCGMAPWRATRQEDKRDSARCAKSAPNAEQPALDAAGQNRLLCTR
jgi:hypothetical protein